MLSSTLDSVIKRAEFNQKKMFEFIESTMKANPKINYQDAVVTFILLKISEIEELRSLSAYAEQFK